MRKKVLIILGVVLVVVCFIIFGGGGTISIGGAFVFTSEYHSTPQKAVDDTLHECSIQEDIYVLRLDDYNCMYFAWTSTDMLFVAPMRTKNEKYHYLGDYALYLAELDGNILSDGNFKFSDRIVTYGKWGFADKKMKYGIVYDEAVIPTDPAVNKVKVESDVFRDFWFVYELEDK